MSRGIWRREDGEIFLGQHVEPALTKLLGAKALGRGAHLSLRRETSLEQPDGSYTSYVGEVERHPGVPLSVEVTVIDARVLSDEEALVQWPSIKACGLGEELAESTAVSLDDDPASLERLIEATFSEHDGQDALSQLAYGEPILAYAARSVMLARRRRPRLNCEFGYVYENQRYPAYDRLVDEMGGGLIGDNPAELRHFAGYSRQLRHDVDCLEFADLNQALRLLGLGGR